MSVALVLVDAAPGSCFGFPVTRTVEADYLVVGAGAMGMAFTDALIDHADVRVALVDRRHGVGGHWLEAYPFVRLHQSSTFYGVASTVLGGGRIQQRRARGGAPRAGRPADDLRLLRRPAGGQDAGVGPGRVLRRLRLPRGPHLRLARLGSAVRGAGAVPDRRRALPRSRHPGGDTAEVRGRRRRPGDPGQRPGADRRGTEPVRRRRLRQDRDRRLHLAAGARGGPRRDLLGAATRARGC